MADGGYPKAWRHYVNEPYFKPWNQASLDIEEMEFSLGPDARQMSFVRNAEKMMGIYFGSIRTSPPNGSDELKEQALTAIDAMERELNR